MAVGVSRDLSSTEGLYREYVRGHFQRSAPTASQKVERDFPPSWVAAAFAIVWDSHQSAWKAARTADEHDAVARESIVTILKRLAQASESKALLAGAARS